jgi:hypothetical protein
MIALAMLSHQSLLSELRNNRSLSNQMEFNEVLLDSTVPPTIDDDDEDDIPEGFPQISPMSSMEVPSPHRPSYNTFTAGAIIDTFAITLASSYFELYH